MATPKQRGKKKVPVQAGSTKGDDVYEPQFTRGADVGWRDRGHGRGDVLLVHDSRNLLVAEIKSMGEQRDPDGDLIVLPARENAFLFAAAPELYDAAKLAFASLEVLGHAGPLSESNARLMKKLRAALDKVTAPPGHRDGSGPLPKGLKR